MGSFGHRPKHSWAITIINEDMTLHSDLLKTLRKVRVSNRSPEDINSINSHVQTIKSLKDSLKCLSKDK